MGGRSPGWERCDPVQPHSSLQTERQLQLELCLGVRAPGAAQQGPPCTALVGQTLLWGQWFGGPFAQGLCCGSSNSVLTGRQCGDHPALGGLGWGTPFLLDVTLSSPSLCSTYLRSVFPQLHEKDHSLCLGRWVSPAGCCVLLPARSS